LNSRNLRTENQKFDPLEIRSELHRKSLEAATVSKLTSM
jgi:hypothetical protein